MNAYNVNRHLQLDLYPPTPAEVAAAEAALEVTNRRLAIWTVDEVAALARQSARQAPVAPSPWDHVDQLALLCGGCAGQTWDHQCWTAELWQGAA